MQDDAVDGVIDGDADALGAQSQFLITGSAPRPVNAPLPVLPRLVRVQVLLDPLRQRAAPHAVPGGRGLHSSTLRLNGKHLSWERWVVQLCSTFHRFSDKNGPY